MSAPVGGIVTGGDRQTLRAQVEGALDVAGGDAPGRPGRVLLEDGGRRCLLPRARVVLVCERLSRRWRSLVGRPSVERSAAPGWSRSRVAFAPWPMTRAASARWKATALSR